MVDTYNPILSTVHLIYRMDIHIRTHLIMFGVQGV
jgi:hypothetical protein